MRLYLNLKALAFIIFVLQIPSLGAAKNCDSVQSTQELYECALENQPDLKAAAVLKEAAEASKEKATQLPNPDLTVKSTSAERAGEKVGGTEITLEISVTDLLVKRAALNKSGRSEEKALHIEAQEKEYTAKFTIVRDLYRYRQILQEYEVLSEAISTFEKIEAMYRSRRARGPEQNITLNLIQLAQGDYQLRKNHLAVEKAEIEMRFKSVLGPKFEFTKNALPRLKETWPEVAKTTISKNTFELRKLEAAKERMEAEKSLANIDSWPKVVAGPVSERVTEGINQYTQYGFTVTVGVPIFSLNGGARSLAGKNLILAQMQYDYANKAAELERELLIQKYSSAVESLKKSASAESLKAKHSQVDAYFRQGLATSATVIEAHRQITEFTESQHEHEIVALESLMYLNYLSGKDPSEVLK